MKIHCHIIHCKYSFSLGKTKKLSQKLSENQLALAALLNCYVQDIAILQQRPILKKKIEHQLFRNSLGLLPFGKQFIMQVLIVTDILPVVNVVFKALNFSKIL